jgi:CheY-like chemotaxis protein
MEAPGRANDGRADVAGETRQPRAKVKSRVLVVENEKALRDSLGLLLDESGYDVAVADDGRDALRLLHVEMLPDLIILDLKMPVMDGWEFRTIQKDDPKLSLIPILAVSADASPKATAISAQGYLRKPFDAQELLTAVEHVLFENVLGRSARRDEIERLARLAATVGHEVNNPLTFVMLNLRQSLAELRAVLGPLEAMKRRSRHREQLEQIEGRIAEVVEMLEECEVGGERIRGAVTNLRQLSHETVERRPRLDV